MAVKVAINGYGRIGRNVLRALYEANRNHEIQIVAVNDLGDAETNAHLTQYDTAHGKFPHEVSVDGGDLVIKGDKIKVFAERDPASCPGVRLVSMWCWSAPVCSPARPRHRRTSPAAPRT